MRRAWRNRAARQRAAPTMLPIVRDLDSIPQGASASDEHPPSGVLRRELGLVSAVLLGLGAILGTGVFVSLGIAAGVAGPAVLLSIGIAALVALGNALSSAQLAASHPVSGGTYEYGYRYLHGSLGFTAGWLFLFAKSASAAAAALGFAGYLAYGLDLPLGLRRWIAAATVLGLGWIVHRGLRRSARVNAVIVCTTLVALVLFIVAGLPGALRAGTEALSPFLVPNPRWASHPMGAWLEGAALMFVAFTGYGRIATLAEEVREPRKTIPRAILWTLAISALLYIAVAWVALSTVGAPTFAAAVDGAAAPLVIVARSIGTSSTGSALGTVVSIGAMTAMLGVLLNLLLGLSRVMLAMGRRGDMPRAMARIDGPAQTPQRAVVAVTLLVLALALVGNLRLAWSFSAFAVLAYYALTNLAALRLPREDRFAPRLAAFGGLAGCLFLAFWVEVRVWAAGCVLIAAGLVWRHIAHRSSAPKQ